MDFDHFDDEEASAFDRNQIFLGWLLVVRRCDAEPDILIRLYFHFEEVEKLVVDLVPLNEVHFVE